MYIELVEYPPDGSRAHETSSSSVEKVHRSNILQRFSHSTASAKPKVCLNLMRQPSKYFTPETVEKGLSQQLKSLGKRSRRGPDPVHQSSQK
jgi:hypothetical protein